MGYIGNRPTAVPLTSADIQDGVITAADLGANSVDSSELVDNSVTLAKMAGLARGKLIYGDASGDPAALAVGGADEVLTHDGTDLAWAAAAGGANFDTAITINDSGNDVNFRIETNNDANCFFVDGGYDEIYIGSSTRWGNAKLQVFSNHTTTDDLIEGITVGSYTTGTAANGVGTNITFIGSMTGQNGVEFGQIGFHNTDVSGAVGDFVILNRPNAASVERFRVASNGDLTATDTSISSNSDERLKENISDFTYDISKFKQLRPRTFDWKNPIQHNGKSDNRGFIAQETQLVDDYWIDEIQLGQYVAENPDGSVIEGYTSDHDLIGGNHKSLTSKLGKKDAMYVSIINQLITKIETLETKVTALENA